jgi:hypothetical protein
MQDKIKIHIQELIIINPLKWRKVQTSVGNNTVPNQGAFMKKYEPIKLA